MFSATHPEQEIPLWPPGWINAAGTDGRYEALMRALYDAIPKKEKKRLSRLEKGTIKNGGTSRGWDCISSAIATYNNTVKDEQEIIDWFERALVGIRME